VKKIQPVRYFGENPSPQCLRPLDAVGINKPFDDEADD
jgi:hypothetical protein